MTGGRVVVIGRTGRNFAAGMSGGIAYVYDPDGDFHIRCNKDMVDLEAMDEEDIELVHGLIERHRGYTGSTVAEGILKQWPTVAQKFVKVFPKDFKRALREHLEEAKTDVMAAQALSDNGKKANGRKASGKAAGDVRALRPGSGQAKRG
jgi:glutamate synthase domain-containing protein 3